VSGKEADCKVLFLMAGMWGRLHDCELQLKASTDNLLLPSPLLLLLLLLLLRLPDYCGSNMVHLQSVFNPVMKNAINKGVVIVKAAGNSGRDGPFNADVATAAGMPCTAHLASLLTCILHKQAADN
jgi:hypothetical protein